MLQRLVAHEIAHTNNRGGYVPGMIAQHERLTDDWANYLYLAYCEALHHDVLNSAVLRLIHSTYGTDLLPQAFPEGADGTWYRRGRLHYGDQVLLRS